MAIVVQVPGGEGSNEMAALQNMAASFMDLYKLHEEWKLKKATMEKGDAARLEGRAAWDERMSDQESEMRQLADEFGIPYQEFVEHPEFNDMVKDGLHQYHYNPAVSGPARAAWDNRVTNQISSTKSKLAEELEAMAIDDNLVGSSEWSKPVFEDLRKAKDMQEVRAVRGQMRTALSHYESAPFYRDTFREHLMTPATAQNGITPKSPWDQKLTELHTTVTRGYRLGGVASSARAAEAKLDRLHKLKRSLMEDFGIDPGATLARLQAELQLDEAAVAEMAADLKLDLENARAATRTRPSQLGQGPIASAQDTPAASTTRVPPPSEQPGADPDASVMTEEQANDKTYDYARVPNAALAEHNAAVDRGEDHHLFSFAGETGRSLKNSGWNLEAGTPGPNLHPTLHMAISGETDLSASISSGEAFPDGTPNESPPMGEWRGLWLDPNNPEFGLHTWYEQGGSPPPGSIPINPVAATWAEANEGKISAAVRAEPRKYEHVSAQMAQASKAKQEEQRRTEAEPFTGPYTSGSMGSAPHNEVVLEDGTEVMVPAAQSFMALYNTVADNAGEQTTNVGGVSNMISPRRLTEEISRGSLTKVEQRMRDASSEMHDVRQATATEKYSLRGDRSAESKAKMAALHEKQFKEMQRIASELLGREAAPDELMQIVRLHSFYQHIGSGYEPTGIPTLVR